MAMILVSVITVLAMCLGIYIGQTFGEQQGAAVGYEYGYEDGYEKGLREQLQEIDFPKTLDGKFFSTEAALRSMSKPGGDD